MIRKKKKKSSCSLREMVNSFGCPFFDSRKVKMKEFFIKSFTLISLGFGIYIYSVHLRNQYGTISGWNIPRASGKIKLNSVLMDIPSTQAAKDKDLQNMSSTKNHMMQNTMIECQQTESMIITNSQYLRS